MVERQELKRKRVKETRVHSDITNTVSNDRMPLAKPVRRAKHDQKKHGGAKKATTPTTKRPVTESDHELSEEEEIEETKSTIYEDSSDAYSESEDYEMDTAPDSDVEMMDHTSDEEQSASEEEEATEMKRSKSTSKDTREARRKQKELQMERRLQKPGQERVQQLKKCWEKLRRRDQSKEKREALVNEALSLIGNDFAEIIFKHDASRIIQSCLKYGTPEQRQKIAEGLKNHFIELAKSKYGQFIAIRILDYCPKMRDVMIKEFRGKIHTLIRHKEASSVIEEMFSRYANAEQRASLVSEFYGREFVLFKTGPSRTLSQILEKEPHKRESILKNMYEMLSGTLTKGIIQYSIVHRALLEYLTFAKEADIMTMIGLVGEQAVEILHTKDGAQATMLMLAHAGPKERKLMIRSFKPYVIKICKEEFGHMVLLRLFDVVDDTVLVRKAILSTIAQNLGELIEDRYGHRVILYLLAGRKPRYFFKQVLDLLASGDEIRARTSKKDPELRFNELLEAISPDVIQFVAEHPEIVLQNYGSQLVTETLISAKGDKSKAIDALVGLVNQAATEGEENVLGHNLASRVYKAIIVADKDGSIGFARKLLEAIRGELYHHATNYGGFVVLALLENPITQADTHKELKTVKKKLATAAKEHEQQKGLALLVEKLNCL